MKALVEVGRELTDNERERFARHISLPGVGEEAQRRLRNAKVLMIGAGGLGSPALLYLAAAGVGTIGIVDSDVVDLSNLQRQVIHSNAAIGEPKVESAKRRLLELDPDIDVRTYQVRLDVENIDPILDGYDLILDGTDNIEARFLISDAAVRASKPVVWATILQWNAQLSFFWTGERAVEYGMPGPNGISLRDVFPTQPPGDAIPKTVNVGLLGSVPGTAGTIMAAEAFKVITGTGEPLIGRIMYVDMLNSRTYEIPVSPRG